MKSLMMLLFTVLMFQMNAQDIVGDWKGKISYQGTELRVVFHVTGQNGKFQSTMDSPDQGATGIPTDQTTFEDGKLTIKAFNLAMEYTADLDSKGETLTGTFNQSGIKLPLVMTKGEEKKSR